MRPPCSSPLLVLTVCGPPVIGLTSCFVLFGTAGYLYLPDHIAFVAARAKYYLLGQENPDATVAQSIQRLVASWSWNETGTRVASVTEL